MCRQSVLIIIAMISNWRGELCQGREVFELVVLFLLPMHVSTSDHHASGIASVPCFFDCGQVN